MRVKGEFFARGAEVVARDLLGKTIVRDFGEGREVRGQITETEAYVGESDLASHTRFGRTKRTEAMYGEPGTVYMFFTYGVHWMFNIVCAKKNDPQAVLVRGVRVVGWNGPAELADHRAELDGPGKAAKYLELDGSFYGEDLITSKRLWVEENKELRIMNYEILTTPRVCIDYAKEWKNKPLRFLLKFTSK